MMDGTPCIGATERSNAIILSKRVQCTEDHHWLRRQLEANRAILSSINTLRSMQSSGTSKYLAAADSIELLFIVMVRGRTLVFARGEVSWQRIGHAGWGA